MRQEDPPPTRGETHAQLQLQLEELGDVVDDGEGDSRGKEVALEPEAPEIENQSILRPFPMI